MSRSSVLVAVVLTLAPGAARADNWSNFPAAKCVKSGTNGTLVVNYGRAYNSHPTQGLTLSCPIDRQNVLDGGIVPGSFAWVIDDHATSSVRCTLYVRDPSTDTAVWDELVSTPAGQNSNTPYQLVFAGTHPADAEEVYHMSCVLPPASGGYSALLGIRVQEDGSEYDSEI